jgi:hypothetical protein
MINTQGCYATFDDSTLRLLADLTDTTLSLEKRIVLLLRDTVELKAFSPMSLSSSGSTLVSVAAIRGSRDGANTLAIGCLPSLVGLVATRLADASVAWFVTTQTGEVRDRFFNFALSAAPYGSLTTRDVVRHFTLLHLPERWQFPKKESVFMWLWR